MDATTEAYLKRVFDRLRDEAVNSARVDRQRVMAKAASQGALTGGRTLMLVKAEYERAGAEAAESIARSAFEKTESTDENVCRAIEVGLHTLRDALSNDLADWFRTFANWAPSVTTSSQGNEFLHSMDKLIVAVLDDYRHGMLGGKRLTKDPLVNFVASITDSPGAVLQAGSGNVQHAVTTATDLRAALREFVGSKEVQALPQNEKESVIDVADVLNEELKKPGPDSSKVARWGKRLIGIAQEVGVAVAAAGLAKGLFG